MEKDYIIFEHAPIIRFTTTVPFTCEANFNNVSAWYSSQTRDTPKPRPKIFGTISTTCSESSFNLQDISANLSVHGNYTAYYRQKSFKLHLNTPQNLFGLNKGVAAKDWILLADYGDNSKLRNALALYMGQQFFRGQWASSFTLTHVYINDEYYGMYLLCDKKEVSPTRININSPEEGYTGVDIGYFFERDDYLTYDNKDPGFVITYPDEYLPSPLPKIYHETNESYGVDATYKDEYSMSSKIYSQNQLDFIKKYTCLVYTIMYEACINETYYEINSSDINNWQSWELVPSQLTDPIAVIGKVVDINSFVDTYLLQEIAGNPDLAHSSYYLGVDMSETGNRKLFSCCPWDFDRAFGISNGLMSADSVYLWARGAHYNPWISLLPQANWFVELLKIRYTELRTTGVFNKCIDMLNDYIITYESDFAQNYTKYSIKWEGDNWGWVADGSPARIGTLNESYYVNINTEAEAAALLKTWFNNRINALYIIFNRSDIIGETPTAPIITFKIDDPFSCEDDLFDNFESWYQETNENTARPRILGKITVNNCDQAFYLSDVAAELKIRGNYTANYSKKPFQIKFNKKQNLLGLNNGKKNKKWVLLAEYNDGSMLRNAISFYMASQIMPEQWVPTSTYAHLYIDTGTKKYYQGLYLVADNKEQNDTRVNVPEPPTDDYTGTDIGYFVERDDYFASEDSDPTFFIGAEEYKPVAPIKTSSSSNSWARQSQGNLINGDGFTIKSTVTSQNQVTFFKQRLLKIYEIIYRAVYLQEYYELDDNNNLIPSALTSPIEVLNKTINLTTFVNTYILQSIVCNPDIGHSSFYFSLDMSETGDKRLWLNSPWDFDLTMGLAKRFVEDPTTDLDYAKDCTLNPWVSLLPNAEWFMQLVKTRWQELWDSAFFAKTLRKLDIDSALYTADFRLNFTEWNIRWVKDANATWNIDGTAVITTISGYEIIYTFGPHPLANVRSLYGKSNITSEAVCKDLLYTWLTSRFMALHRHFDGQGDIYVEPLDTPIPDKAGVYRCVKVANGYRLEPVYIFGAGNIRRFLGGNISDQNLVQIMYRLRDQKFKTFFRLDLETGGEYLEEFDGYKNWFPGCTTYGFIRSNDTDIYNKVLVNGEYQYVPSGHTVRHYGQDQTMEDSTIEILEVLDGIDTNSQLRRKLQLMWHIRTNSGLEGYINANSVTDIFYKVKAS